MSARPPHSIALDQALADGHWHPRRRTTDDIARHVPPGQAARRAARNRDRWPAADRPTSRRDDIEVGAHDIAARLIAERIRTGRIEHTVINGAPFIRRTPSA